MKKLRAIALVLCLLMMLPAAASAITYPEKSGYTADSAGILSDSFKSDMEILNDRLEQAYGGHAWLYVTHFLGGNSVGEYAKQLFERWSLTDRDILFVMALGEETYALRLGAEAAKALKSDSSDLLLASYFRTPYQERKYGEAIAALLPELFKRVAYYQKADLNLNGIFSSDAGDTVSNGVFDWSGFITSGNVNWTDYSDEYIVGQESVPKYEKKGSTFSFSKVLIILAILYFLFGRKNRKNRFNFRHEPKR